MGGCCSTPDDKYEAGNRQASASTGHETRKHKHTENPKTPDFGLGTDFEVIRLLGTGGEGETWLCIDQRTKQEVAIKLVRRPIPRSITQIIQREIKILADLGDGHLNIVHADEVLLTRTHVGLVMEYVAGDSASVSCFNLDLSNCASAFVQSLLVVRSEAARAIQNSKVCLVGLRCQVTGQLSAAVANVLTCRDEGTGRFAAQQQVSKYTP